MKRLRDGTEVDHNLIKIYEDLASEDETERLQAVLRLEAAYTDLITSNNDDQRRTVLTRLFRGLSSGRKAARLGFAIALTRILSRRAQDDTISPAELIRLLVKCTKPDSNTSGQDERDHYFGRMFGCEAIIRSEILFSQPSMEDWNRLLDILCNVALQKPWLRQVCGWTLFTCVRTSLKNSENQHYAVRILEKMTEHKLVRTPEGLAIWIEVKRLHPKSRMPQHIWKHDDPLDKNDLRTLANVLKDAKVSSKDDSEFEVQGSAMWAANLHFVWDVLLRELLTEEVQHDKKHQEYVQQFWKSVVDDSLFNPANSQERKHWGFLAMQRALDIASPKHHKLIEAIFSRNAVDCLVLSLKNPEGYLTRSAQTVIEKMQNCCIKDPGCCEAYIMALLRGVRMIDFDLTTRTKTIASLIDHCDSQALRKLVSELDHELVYGSATEGTATTQFRRLVLNQVFKLLTREVHRAMVGDNAPREQSIIEQILMNWTKHISKESNLVDVDKQLVVEKLKLGLEQVLKLGKYGQMVIMKICSFNKGKFQEEDVDEEILEIVQNGEDRFDEFYRAIELPSKDKKGISKTESVKSKTGSPAKMEGLTLLYALLLFEIYTGDKEVIPVLQELLETELGGVDKKDTNVEVTESSEVADALVDILLSFASRPSKFLRRITLTIFESMTSDISREGLRSLTDILKAKETKIGQQQLFETNDDDEMAEDGDDSEDEEDSDVEMLDSDVEVIDASESTSTDDDEDEDEDKDDDSSSSVSGSDSASESGSPTSEPDASLLALEASLASVLGTRKLTQPDATDNSSFFSASDDDDSGSGSDSDMTDTEMLALDDKLGEFFRARAATTQTSTQKKKENKSARDTVVNFKNRVLDMLEAYVKREYLNPRVLEIILPCLGLARGQTKQLAERAVKILTLLCKKCHGLEKVPVLSAPAMNGHKSESKSKNKSKKNDNLAPSDASISSEILTYTTPAALQLLVQIHAEVGRANTSNLHRSMCSKTSILVAKTLLKAGVEPGQIRAVYDETERRKEEDPQKCHVHAGFFEDWKTWKASVKGRIDI